MAKKKMSFLDWLAIVLLTLGGLVHGFAVFGWDALAWLKYGWLIKTVQSLVGIAALYTVYWLAGKAWRMRMIK